MNNEEVQKLISFFIEVDKLKNVYRRTSLIDNSRYETVAEHSWHFALMSVLLHKYANIKVDLLRVLKMALIHDLVEIYSGDTYAFSDVGTFNIKEKEDEAAKKIFNFLPYEQYCEYYELWKEFEEKKTYDSIYANSIDRLQPLLNECYRNNVNGISAISQKEMLQRMRVAEKGIPELWTFIEELIKIHFGVPNII